MMRRPSSVAPRRPSPPPAAADARSGTATLRRALGGRGADLTHSTDWIHQLSAEEIDEAQVQLLDLIDELAHDPEWHLDMAFEPGDVQLLANHVVMHSRTHYEDHDDPAEKRHLLRLWLTLHRHAPSGDGWGGIPTSAEATSIA